MFDARRPTRAPRRWALAAVAAALLALGGTGWAQTTPPPGPTIRLVVPFAPGGAQDVIGRYLAERLGPRLGQTVIVDNRAGAGGVIAADAVAKAAPDGLTLLLATGGAISIAPHLQAKLPYDVARDLIAVGSVADTPMTLATSSQSPWRSVADVVKEAGAKPGALAYASTGNATVSHLTGELFAQTAGVKLLHTPYRGAAPALNDLLGGQVPLIVTSTASIDPHADSGRARVLATFTAQRIWPTVPTMTEAGYAGLEVPVWVGVMAPARTPAALLERLATELQAICQLPQTRERYRALGAEPKCQDRAAFAKTVVDDTARWGRVIRNAGIKAE